MQGIYAGWRGVMEELDRQEVILQENQDSVSQENLIKLRMFRETIKGGPIIRKEQVAA